MASRFINDGRFIYAGPYRQRDKAESVLEDMFATGDVFISEKPDIERLNDHRGKLIGYVVTLPA